jgi:branched-chain amino acid transport system permease protein
VPEVAWGRALFAALVLGGVVLLPYVVGLERQILGSVVIIYAIVAVSLVILTGWAGQISLGQWGLAGVGALVAGGLAAHLQSDFFLTLLAAGAAGAIASLLIGLPALRIQGLYLAVTTLAFAIAVQVYLLSPKYFASILPSNSQTIERPLLYGHFNINGPRAYYYVCLVTLALALASARALRRSRAGRVIVAGRDNVRGAQSYGVSVQRARLAAFAISGFWAAIAGALFAYHQKVVETQAFDPSISLLILLIVVIGGVTSLPGAMLGAAWIGVLRYGGFSPQVQSLASGVGVLLLLWVLPGGLAQGFYGIRDALLRWVAERRGIVVPSLLADVQAQADVSTLLEEGRDKQVLPTATVSAVTCPVCGEAVPVLEVAGHEHFAPVPG